MIGLQELQDAVNVGNEPSGDQEAQNRPGLDIDFVVQHPEFQGKWGGAVIPSDMVVHPLPKALDYIRFWGIGREDVQNHFNSESTQPSPRLPGPGVGDPRTAGMETLEKNETTEVPFFDFLGEQEE
jgi:hypothetical protein